MAYPRGKAEPAALPPGAYIRTLYCGYCGEPIYQPAKEEDRACLPAMSGCECRPRIPIIEVEEES